jgi:hypothetical protein
LRVSVLSRKPHSHSTPRSDAFPNAHTQPYTTDKQNNWTQTSLLLQQIWPAVPKLIGYNVAVQQRDATRLPFCPAFPVLSWLCYIILGSGECVILPRGISDNE